MNYTRSSIILRWLSIYTSFSIILGCGGVSQDDIQTRIPLNLAEVDEIIATFPMQDPSLNVVFDDSSFADPSSSGTGTLGYCLVEINTVVIDERFWVGATREVKEALMYHEMAHCLLGIGHHSGTLMDSFIGFGAMSYRKRGLSELYDLPCGYDCDSNRIKENRNKWISVK